MDKKLLTILPLAFALPFVLVGCSEDSPTTQPTAKTTIESSPDNSPTTNKPSTSPSVSVTEKIAKGEPQLPIGQADLNTIVNNAKVFTAIALSSEMGQKEKTVAVADYVMPEYRIFNKAALNINPSGEKPDPDYTPPPPPPPITPDEVDVTRYLLLSPDRAILETKVEKTVFQLWFAPYNKNDWRITNIAWDNCPITVACPYVTKTIQELEK